MFVGGAVRGSYLGNCEFVGEAANDLHPRTGLKVKWKLVIGHLEH